MNTFYSLAHVPHQLTYNFVRDFFLLVCLFTNDITFLDYYNYDRLVTGCWKVKSAAKRILKTSLWLVGSRLPWLPIVCIGDAHLHVNCEAEHEWNLKKRETENVRLQFKNCFILLQTKCFQMCNFDNKESPFPSCIGPFAVSRPLGEQLATVFTHAGVFAANYRWFLESANDQRNHTVFSATPYFT